MDKLKQKSKKEKPLKYVERDKIPPLFITDVKTIKENLKIKEILRTVKMNSSMRMKAPKGSKVMQNKDFNDNEDIFEGDSNSQDSNTLVTDVTSATNPDVVVNNNSVETNEEVTENIVDNDVNEPDEKTVSESNENNTSLDTPIHEPSIEPEPEGISNHELISDEDKQNNPVVPEVKIDTPPPIDSPPIKTRDRKLSLDQTMLSRGEGLSQSELDLNSIGKSPLERKSSFFRKKMDSFLRNTTEMFRRQSIKSQTMQRRGSSMSISLQSLNENSAFNGDYGVEQLHKHQEEHQGSASSLQSSLTAAQSNSSLSISQSERTPDPQSEANSLAGSRPILTNSQPLGDITSDSFNEAYIQESLLNSRAISMSSGLDTAHGTNRRKNRTNRVTWLASEGLTNYLRRIIQDETTKSGEIHTSHSYQDFSAIPQNNQYGSKTDSKGRRLSYQRAVSGEDPRYLDSSLRRRQIPESSEANYELAARLADFQTNGVPGLKGFQIASIPDEAFAYLHWAEKPQNLEDFFDWKLLPPNEEARQAVIRELVATEADYIRHLLAIVEVFMATAHALQDGGKLLDIETERLFTNIPDVLNASLYFWECSIFPMLQDAACNTTPFNTELMSAGFCRFRELFLPYEKYVNEQTKALDYLRSLSSNTEFMTYLTWCHAQKACNRLQLSDIMVKPMQRLTKYSLILRRIIAHTDFEPERTNLRAMESFAKNYVLDLNRSIRQREELEKLEQLAASIEAYEIDFKDEEIERHFRLYAAMNLKAPMMNCTPNHSRTLIYQGDLRYKDNSKEIEVRAFLLTDMLLICKKQSTKGGQVPQYKLIRPKYFIDKMVTFPKHSRNTKELNSLIAVILDECGSSYFAFSLSETSKDPNASTLKVWDQKFREAKFTYDLAVWFARNPSREISEIVDSSSDYCLSLASGSKGQKTSDDLYIEREARERVAAMLHRSMGASTEYDFSQVSMATDSFDGEPQSGAASAGRPGMPGLRHPMKRNSTGGSSRNSRLSSFQQSTSAASHDEPQPGPSRYMYRAGSSVEHVITPINPDDGVTSITVNVVSESESETMVQKQQPQPPMLVLQQSSPHKTPVSSRSPSGSRNTLRVQPQNVVMALVHSLPDLTIDPSPPPPRPQQSPSPQSASEKLYQSHQELLQRNRLSAQHHQHYLSPDHRGTSYPPPSPTRASLTRGLAFSYSFKNPPLSKMGHVNSQSQVHAEAGPSTSQGHKGDKSGSPVPGPSTSAGSDIKPEKEEKKKSKHFSSRHKSGGSGGTGSSASPGSSRKDDKGD